MTAPAMTLYYDGNCSICRAQMSRLRKRDRAGCLAFSDITAPGFVAREVGVNMEALGTQIHVRTADGCLLVGIDSLIAIYTALGRGWWVAPLRWRMLRPLFSAMYRSLARNRYRLSACADGVCNMAGKS